MRCESLWRRLLSNELEGTYIEIPEAETDGDYFSSLITSNKGKYCGLGDCGANKFLIGIWRFEPTDNF